MALVKVVLLLRISLFCVAGLLVIAVGVTEFLCLMF